MNISFYDITQTNIQHTAEALSYKEDADKISGVDFFATEAKTCKITFFEDDWLKNNLLNIPIGNCIEDSTILEMPMLFTRNGVQQVYYLQRDDIAYNKKTLQFEVKGINLLGVLIKLSETIKDYSAEEYSSIDLVEDTIDDLLADLVYTIDNNANAQFVNVTDYQLPIKIKDEYFVGDCEWGGISGYEVFGRFKYIGIVDNNLTLVLYLKNEWGCPDPDGSTMTILNYRYGFENDYVPVLNYKSERIGERGDCPANLPDTISGLDPEIPQLTYTSGNDTYEIVGSEVYYSGTVDMETIYIKEDEEGSSEIEIKDMLKSLLILNNVYIYAIGNTIYLGNKNSTPNLTQIITDNDIIDYKESYVRFSDVDYNSLTDNFEAGSVIANFLNFYYNDLKATINQSVSVKILNTNDYDFELLDGIDLYGEHYMITEIHLDNDEFAYTIKAWSV